MFFFKVFFLGYANVTENIKGTLHFYHFANVIGILFCMFSERSETSS